MEPPSAVGATCLGLGLNHRTVRPAERAEVCRDARATREQEEGDF
jgi:hypothetical protein